MKNTILLFLLFAGVFFRLSAATYYVAPNGKNTNSGTSTDSPIDIYSAVGKAQAGDVIYLLSGKYDLSQTVNLTNSGTAEAPIQLLPYDAWTPFDVTNPLNSQNVSTRPILSFTGTPHITAGASKADADKARGFLHTGDYWVIKGINITDAGDNGVKLEGSYNIYELCCFWRNGDTGHQIGFSHNASDNPGLQKGAYNKMINCDSWDNWDAPDWGDADGFACKMYPGLGNEYYGCRAWNNSDDGWDLYEVQSAVVLDHCWTWNNAKEPGKSGNGNGFKMGGSPSKGRHILHRCIAWGNKARGFDQNSNSDGMIVVNGLSFRNSNNYMHENGGKDFVVYNNVEFEKTGSMTLEFKLPADIQNNSWQLFDGATGKEEYKLSKVNYHAEEYEEESLTESAFLALRKADGSLPGGVAVLKETSRFRNAGIGYSLLNPTTGAEMSLFTSGTCDIGPHQYVEDPDAATLSKPSNMDQAIKEGDAIAAIIFTWGGAATDVTVSGIPSEMSVVKSENTLTISGIPQSGFTYMVETVGGTTVSRSGKITFSSSGGTVEPVEKGILVKESSLSISGKTSSKVWGPFNLLWTGEAGMTMSGSGSSNNTIIFEYSPDGETWTQAGSGVRNSSTNKEESRTIDTSSVPSSIVYFRLTGTTNYTVSIKNLVITGEVALTTALTQIQSEKGRIVSETIYTLSGMQVKEVGSGIYLKKIVYENGHCETIKFFKNRD